MRFDTTNAGSRQFSEAMLPDLAPSLRDFEVVCLFSLLGLVLTAAAIVFGGFDEIVPAMAQLAL